MHRIVILGGGFGGVYTAANLQRMLPRDADIEVTLVSRDNYLLMTPLLFEAGSGILEPRHSVYPIRAMLKRSRFVEAEVVGIDFDRHMVQARPGLDEIYEIGYDQLVIAVGGVTNRSIIPGSEHAMTFKTLADGIFFRNYVIDLFERADVERSPQRKAAMLSFIVVGAGLVGVELMGELTDFTRHVCRSYRQIDPSELRYEMLEAGPRIMPEMEPKLSTYASEILCKRGVRIRTSAPARQLDADRVQLQDGSTIAGDTIILAVGVAPNPLLKDLPLEKDRKGRISVDPTMRSRSHPDLWAIGDCAAIPDPTGKPYPQLAQHALREAKVLAANLLTATRHREGQPFVYKTLGTLAALGHHKGVGRIGKLRVRGFLAWWIWRTYYLFQMPGWDRRIRIILDWTIALLFKNDIVKLDLFGQEHPLMRYEQRLLAQRRAYREVIDDGTTPQPQPGEEAIGSERESPAQNVADPSDFTKGST